MKIFVVLKNLLILIFVCILVFFATTFYSPLRDTALELVHIRSGSVKGASTQKAQELHKQFTQDINKEVEKGKQQVLNMKISDALNIVGRLGKIPGDLKIAQNYVFDKSGEFLNSRFKK